MENLGSRIKYYREQLRLSQFELSQKSDVSQASIARIESGKQKNLKRETMKKLSDGLGMSLIELMESPAVVKEEKAPYNLIRMIPVVQLKNIESAKNLNELTKKADKFEPSFCTDMNAFYLLVTKELMSEPVIDEGDMVLIEPKAGIGEKDMVFSLSAKMRGIGIMYCHPDSFIIQPLTQNIPPFLFKRTDKKQLSKIFKISEIKKKIKLS